MIKIWPYTIKCLFMLILPLTALIEALMKNIFVIANLKCREILESAFWNACFEWATLREQYWKVLIENTFVTAILKCIFEGEI